MSKSEIVYREVHYPFAKIKLQLGDIFKANFIHLKAGYNRPPIGICKCVVVSYISDPHWCTDHSGSYWEASTTAVNIYKDGKLFEKHSTYNLELWIAEEKITEVEFEKDLFRL